MRNEQQLDDKLSRQKKSYENMPHFSSTGSIIEYIETKELEKKRKRQKWRKVPYVAGMAAVLCISIVMASSLNMEWGSGPSQSNSSSTGSEIQKNENIQAGGDDPAPESASSEALQIVPSNNLPMTEALDQVEDMDADDVPQDSIDKYFLELLSNMNQQLTTYRAQWQNKYRQSFYTLVKGSEQDRTAILMGDTEKLAANPDLKSFVGKVVREGFTFELIGEGGIMPVINYQIMQEKFSSALSDKLNTYIHLSSQPRVAIDAAIAVSWNDLSEMLIQRERFLTTYPEFPFNKELKSQYRQFIHYYLNGLPNTVAFENGTLKKEVKDSYLALIENHPETVTAEIVSNHYEKLKENNFEMLGGKAGPKLPDFLSSN